MDGVRAATVLIAAVGISWASVGCSDTTVAKPIVRADFAPCRSSSETEPPFPIAAPGDGSADEQSRVELTGWHFTEEHRAASVADGATRDAATLSGGEGGVQALYAQSHGQHPWNEFLWDSPIWSERTSADPSWASHEEPGAFEPPYQFAYAAQLNYANQMVPLVPRRVFEGTVEVDGTLVALYCADPGRLAHASAPRAARTLRFAVDPSGYVVEWVLAWVGPEDAKCQEISLTISPELDAVGMQNDLPAEWMTTLRLLPGCRDTYQAAEAALST